MEALEKEALPGDSKALAATLLSSPILIGSRSASSIAQTLHSKDRASDVPQPAPLPKTFADIVQGKTQIAQLKAGHSSSFTDPATVQLHTATSEHHGVPSIAFSTSEKLQLVQNLKWVLIGKFSHGRPLLSVIQAFFKTLQLQGDINCALADSKHLFIECSCYVDYYWIWMQLFFNIQGYNMRLFKWEPNFSDLIESPIAPVWIRIVGLALYLFDEMTLLRIASIIGKPIKVDSRNISRSCLSYARVCVELDASKPLIDEIDITIVDDVTGAVIESKKAQILYDVVPKYCSQCSHIGHTSSNCKRSTGSYSLEATKRVAIAAGAGASQGRSTQVWQRVEAQTAAGASRTQAGSRSRLETQQGPPTGLQSAGQGTAAVGQLLQLAEPANATVSEVNNKHHAAADLGGEQGVDHALLQLEGQTRGAELLQVSAAEGPAMLQAANKGPELLPPVVIDRQEVQAATPSDATVVTRLRSRVMEIPTSNVFELLQIGEQEGTDHQITSPASAPTHSDYIASREDKVLQRPSSADSTLGRKQTLVQMLELGPRKSLAQILG